MLKEFEQVIKSNQGRLRYIASRYCSNGDVDDLYQDILLQLWRSFNSFEGQASRATWVYKVALNTACTYVNKAVKHNALKQQIANIRPPICEPAQNNCQAELLNTFMNELNDIDASLLMMYLDGLSSEASAEVVGISANAVRARIKRIKATFENQYVGAE